MCLYAHTQSEQVGCLFYSCNQSLIFRTLFVALAGYALGIPKGGFDFPVSLEQITHFSFMAIALYLFRSLSMPLLTLIADI